MSGEPRKLGKYLIGPTLGCGGFSKVKLGEHEKTGEKVALKILEKKGLDANKSIMQQVQREIDSMQRIQHKNVIRLKHVDWDCKYIKKNGKEKDVILVVLELATGGELFEFLSFTGNFDEKLGRTYFRQLMDGVAYAHGQGVAHRDLKPENLLLNQDFVLKLADFGFAHTFSTHVPLMYTECGTPGYMAPEMFTRGSGYEGNVADLWACGVILFIMLAGFPPFQKPQLTDWWFHKLANNKHALFWQAHCRSATFSEPTKDFINKLLVPEPSKRMTLQQMAQHEWFRGPVYNDQELLAQMTARKEQVDVKKQAEKREKAQKDNAMIVDAMGANYSLENQTVRALGKSDSDALPKNAPGLHPGALNDVFAGLGKELGKDGGRMSGAFGDDSPFGGGAFGFSEEKDDQKGGQPPEWDPSAPACYTKFESSASGNELLSRLQKSLAGLSAKVATNDNFKIKGTVGSFKGAIGFSAQIFHNKESGKNLVEVRRRQGDAEHFRSFFHALRESLSDLVEA